MAGIITLKFQLIPNGVSLFKMTHPIFFPGPVQPHFGPGRYLTFEGISVDEQGKQHYLDVTIAYRQAVLNCIRYLKQFGYNEYQIYLLLSTAPVEGHVAGVVDSKILA
jgi:formamidase